jgi:hypothetical protein
MKHNCIGTATFASGNRYVGEFRDGKFYGQGTFSLTDLGAGKISTLPSHIL